MDLRLGPAPGKRIFPHAEAGIRAALGQARNHARDQAPKAEAVAALWIDHTRPVWSRITGEWRRVGTTAAAVLIIAVLLHAMFGANGMVVYRQKRAEMQSLKSEVERLQEENDQYVKQIKALKSDPAAIEKEAREQLHYTRQGEVVYVAPDVQPKPANGRASNGN